MKLIKKASGKNVLKISKKEWEKIGKEQGWIKKKAMQGQVCDECGRKSKNSDYDLCECGGEFVWDDSQSDIVDTTVKCSRCGTHYNPESSYGCPRCGP